MVKLNLSRKFDVVICLFSAIGYAKTYANLKKTIDGFARLNVSMVRGDVSVLDMHHLVAERNKPVLHFIDHHELGMFEPEKFLQYMKGAGLNAQFMKNGLLKGRGLYIGVKK